GVFGEGTGQGTTLGMGWFQDGIYCGSSGTPTVLQPSTGSSNVSVPFALDSFCSTNSIQLTTVWSVQAAYEHFWTPSLRTSVVGGYTDISYNATASAMMCNAGSGGAGTITGLTNCGAGSFDWSHYSISSRTQWNITKDFY